MQKKLFFLLVLIIAEARCFAQTYSPVTVSGFNIDAFAESGTNSLSTTTQSLDLSDHVMYTTSFAGSTGLPGGLPNTGTITNGSRTYQLASLTANNCLYISPGATQNLTVSTPAKFYKLSLLGFATEGNSTISISLGFTDGSVISYGSFSLSDWFFGSGSIIAGFGRCIRTASAPYQASGQANGAPSDPRFYPINLTLTCADMVKNLQTIRITHSVGTNAYALAVSGVAYSQTITPSSTNVSCFNGSNGSAGVSVTGTTSPYTYSWSPSGGTSATASGLPQGTYICSITDAAGCTRTSPSITITQPTAITAGTTQSNVSCNSACTGTASISASGGSGPFTYSWSPSGGNTATATGLCANTYTCTITDSLNCTTSKTVTISEPAALSITPSQTDALCNSSCNGTASVSVTGGSGPYNYSWTNTSGTSSLVNSLCAGNYTCTVTDSLNCTNSQSFTINEPTGLSVIPSQTDLVCNAQCSGVAGVTVSGGTGTYTYSWTNNSSTSPSANTLCAGNYTCTITDANNCQTSQSFTINEPSAISISTNVTDATCGGANGTANANVTGGSGTYTYNWTPGNISGSGISGMNSGTYTVQVTDGNGCTQTATANIGTSGGIILNTSSVTNVSCNNACNGSATVTENGGTGPYTYVWTGNSSITASANALCAGSYICTITDVNNCTDTALINITEPSALMASINTSTNVTCAGGSNGNATVTANGGSGTYTYSWTPNGGSNATAASLIAGNYSCIITDANNCTTTASVTISEPAAIIISTTENHTSCGLSNGSITTNVSGGTGTYTYSWIPGNMSTANISNLAAGTYTLSVTDANNCIQTGTATINSSSALSASVSSYSDISCNGLCDGSISSSVGAGTAPYVYNWTPTGGNSATASGLCQGTYTCSITDANSCTTSLTQTISQPNALSANITSQNNINCNGGNTGMISISASGGTGAYQYSWTPNVSSLNTATNLAAGNYSCIITDINNCSTSVNTTLSEPNAITVNGSTTPATCSASDGTASVVATGGAAPYTYSWSSGGNTNATATGLGGGNYTATVTDANGCSITGGPYTVTVINPVDAQFTASTLSGDAPLNVSFHNTSLNAVNYSWDFGDSNNITDVQSTDFTFVNSGTYQVVLTASDNNGCMDTSSVTIVVSETIVYWIPNVFTPNDDKLNDEFKVKGSGLKNISYMIFNRWGELIYKTEGAGAAWDGRTQAGKEAESGVYCYLITITDKTGKVIEPRGSVTLLR